VVTYINYLERSSKETQLDEMLNTYNPMGTVYFPTRIVNNSATLIDNIFINNRRSYIIKPCIDWLLDYDAQLIILNNVLVPKKKHQSLSTLEVLIKHHSWISIPIELGELG
jgi:hypothetical protein